MKNLKITGPARGTIRFEVLSALNEGPKEFWSCEMRNYAYSLIRDGLVECSNGVFYITENGKKWVEKMK